MLGRLLSSRNTKFLDIGCFLGTDIRRLLIDGVHNDQIYGVHTVAEFKKLGYELFRDASKLTYHYLSADFLNPTPELQALEGQIDVIWIGAVLHQFEESRYVEACVQSAKLSQGPGAIVAGYQVGSDNPEQRDLSKDSTSRGWTATPQEMKDVWIRAGEATGSRWEVQAVLIHQSQLFPSNTKMNSTQLKDAKFLAGSLRGWSEYLAGIANAPLWTRSPSLGEETR